MSEHTQGFVGSAAAWTCLAVSGFNAITAIQVIAGLASITVSGITIYNYFKRKNERD